MVDLPCVSHHSALHLLYWNGTFPSLSLYMYSFSLSFILPHFNLINHHKLSVLIKCQSSAVFLLIFSPNFSGTLTPVARNQVGLNCFQSVRWHKQKCSSVRFRRLVSWYLNEKKNIWIDQLEKPKKTKQKETGKSRRQRVLTTWELH